MKQRIGFMVVIIILLSCNNATPHAEPVKTQLPIEGTWELISGTTIKNTDTTFTDYTTGQKMIKIINGTHFAFLKHGLKNSKDSAVYDSGAGTYTLVDSAYTEHLDFCNYREWEGHAFQFTVSINKDTLLQKGIEKLEKLGIDQVIIEKYIRVNDKK